MMPRAVVGQRRGLYGGNAPEIGRFELGRRKPSSLDEVGELQRETSDYVVHVLQEHEFERGVVTSANPANVRLIAVPIATIEAAIAAGPFRSDLVYRLKTFSD